MPRSKAQTAALMASSDDVEAQFYEALQQADLDKLMAVWADDDEVACVHPGGPRVSGLAAILFFGGWNGPIATNGTASFGFQATYSGTNGPASGFRLNNAACS